MEHLVRFITAEGREGTHTAASLDEAVQFIEHLRNTEEASGVRLYRLHEVPIEFRTYYKVEVRADLGDPGAVPADPTLVPPAESYQLGTGDGEVDAAGRRLFSRG